MHATCMPYCDLSALVILCSVWQILRVNQKKCKNCDIFSNFVFLFIFRCSFGLFFSIHLMPAVQTVDFQMATTLPLSSTTYPISSSSLISTTTHTPKRRHNLNSQKMEFQMESNITVKKNKIVFVVNSISNVMLCVGIVQCEHT